MRVYLLCFILSLSGCLGTVEGNPIPEDRLYYPSVLLQNQNTLYVVNTNLDLQYKTGSISQIDLTTGKIGQVTLVPSLPGQALANANFSTLFTTSQHTNSLQNAIAGTGLSLRYNAPYFLALYADQTSGLVGYLTLPTNEPWDLNRFSLVANQPDLQYFTTDPTAGIQIKQSFQIASCFPAPARSYRRVARLGGIKVQGSNTYILTELIIDDPVDNTKFSKRVFLIRTPSSLIPQGKLCSDQTAVLDITQTEKAQAARGLVISNDEKIAYALLDEGPLLVKIGLDADKTKIAVTERIATCKRPETLKLSGDGNTLAVACPKVNELTTYNALDLNLFGKYTAVGNTGGPLDILFDQTNVKQIFVSYQQDNKIGIFKYENSSAGNRSLDFVQWLQLSR